LRDKGELATLTIDPSRLQWGPPIYEYLKTTATTTGLIKIALHRANIKVL